ncbi:MAG: hypothetical protein HXX10_08410 [Rhodoplanes sp.]|nr:hypothetical protein [Rhodoplanes sp.]
MRAIDIRIDLVSPFMTGGEINPLFGVDARLPRDRDQRPVIPGTLLRGVLRDALSAICDRCGAVPGIAGPGRAFIGDLFGRASGLAKGDDPRRGVDDQGASNEPQRGAVTFMDLVADAPGSGTGTMTRIRIDEGLGSAKEGHLQVVDLPFPIDAVITFKGKALLRTASGLTIDAVVSALNTALQVVPAIGAHKSAGFGRVKAFEVGAGMADSGKRTAAAAAVGTATALSFTLAFDGPFLVGAERVAPNVFAGAVEVSGGAIKGAVADALGANGTLPPDLDAFLSRAVFRAARPAVNAHNRDTATSKPEPLCESDSAVRPMAVPFSLSVYDNDQPAPNCKRFDIHDSILDKNPRIIEASAKPPVLAIDWKTDHSKAVSKALVGKGIVPMSLVADVVGRSIRTRTAINPDLGVAKYEGGGGSLFVYDMVEPYLRNDPQKIAWTFEIVASDGFPVGIIESLDDLRVLIGKAPTAATLSFRGAVTRPVAMATKRDGQWQAAVKLETPALLTPTDLLRQNGSDVAEAYRDYFQQIFAPVSVTLVRFFARQHMVGGWQAMRWRAGAHYDPWVATEAGSIFLLAVEQADKDAFAARLSALVADGLPEAGVTGEPRWRHCPMARVNGYGEISLWKPVEPKKLGDWFVDIEA